MAARCNGAIADQCGDCGPQVFYDLVPCMGVFWMCLRYYTLENLVWGSLEHAYIVYNFLLKKNILRQTLYVESYIYVHIDVFVSCTRFSRCMSMLYWQNKRVYNICFRVISYIDNLFTIRNPYKGTMGKIAERFVDRIEKICLRRFEGCKLDPNESLVFSAPHRFSSMSLRQRSPLPVAVPNGQRTPVVRANGYLGPFKVRSFERYPPWN